MEYRHTNITTLSGISSIEWGGASLGQDTLFWGSDQPFIGMFTCRVTVTSNVVGSHSIETMYSGKPQFSNVLGFRFIVDE